ncbi:hypothetical protein SAMN02745126_05035 [Enhydrobacter aerosaccus]|uniref:Uncharacterized protein n=1 Tax=Enhydrobacter aerosaccus TaxID=225324 RepID=A0A1T4SSI4_9HYPH|nr:hypothetical protein [Enhydrobacter aerosaccus]SKA30838.1 hypothetical protein SAMN02745126_05035 [Enhydrobacter aerosaccus]
MFELFFDKCHRVLMARIAGIFGSEELSGLDAAIIRFLSGQSAPERIRGLLDFRALEVLAVPESKIVERARRPPILSDQRVMVAPPSMGERFAVVFRSQQRLATGKEPMVVQSFDEALAFLGVTAPQFDPVAPA